MRFPFQIIRYATTIPAGELALGSDGDPLTASPNTFTGQPENYGAAKGTRTNVFSSRLCNINGWPIQRVVIGYQYQGAGSAPTLNVQFWVLDELTRYWYKVAGPATLVPSTIAFFDHPILADNPMTQSSQPDHLIRREVGALDVAILIANPGAAVDGKYIFPVGADVSSPVT